MSMMKALRFPAFRDNGIAVQLVEVLAVIPENDLVWAILEFNGTGKALDNLSMDDFEKLILSQPSGLVMSWDELKRLSNGFDQTIDCTIIGARTSQDILNARKAGDNFSLCEVILNVFDSTEWSTWACDSELMKNFATIY